MDAAVGRLYSNCAERLKAALRRKERLGLGADDLCGGNISFRVPEGGRYRVFVRLFGHADWESPELDLRAARDTTVELIVPLGPIGLEEIGVSSRGRCGTPGDGRELVRRYELMKQSLAGIIRADSSELVYIAQVVRGIFGRRLDRGDQSRRIWPDTSRVRTTGPLVSPSPDSVAMFGFAVRDPDDMARVFAPTPAILTSEAFLLSHCFGTADESDASRIGLTFRPLRGVQHVAVEGTVWMDAVRGDVIEIEFTFTGIIDFLTPDIPRIMHEARLRFPNSRLRFGGISDRRARSRRRCSARGRRPIVAHMIADAFGEFRVSPPAGTFDPRIDRIGYQSIVHPGLRLESTDTLHLELRIGRDAVPLDPISVVVRNVTEARLERWGFYDGGNGTSICRLAS